MCGIVGYVGKEERCVEVLMNGLKNLEYRGYDSAGLALALPSARGIETIKEVGPLDNLAGAIGRTNGN
jgi:glucosamine--fructose-6-phosphate aminotransferase (isomerizing)